MTDPVPTTPRPTRDTWPDSAWPRVRVAFSTTGDFLAELRARGPNVESLVRATLWWVPDPAGAPMHELYVVATYLRRIAPDVVAITELRHHAGTVWIESDTAPAQPSEQLARRLLGTVEDAARDLGAAVGRGLHVMTADPARLADWAPGPRTAQDHLGATVPPDGPAPYRRSTEGDPWT